MLGFDNARDVRQHAHTCGIPDSSDTTNTNRTPGAIIILGLHIVQGFRVALNVGRLREKAADR